MNIIICEDETEHREFLQATITEYAMFHEPSIEIVLSTSDPDTVLDYLKDQRADCYFLDIELSSTLNGMELARIIRRHDPLAQIIFISMHADKLKLTFKYKLAALDFIVKDAGYDKLALEIQDTLKVAFETYQKIGINTHLSYVQVKIGERIKNILYDDIYSFETASQDHKIILHERNGVYEFYGSLSTYEQIDRRFYRCHKSFLINLDYIKEVNLKNRIVILTNGHVCPVSSRKVRELQAMLKK
ncbi:LytTR family DNA-binding domain-containing protein [Amphibacillus sp. MSJ-3]|uniref:LytR/AlgR family response regulator transcription factor n=1 Tax=Amphibacillus sp. MSJ-3 TaxID=2841505 RepID=UPI001C0EE4AD|nr:LytTR family DNA-binding domain-containing protein [Amphibacillus sp. MSJ-3]MBU5595013.1 LytTR family DNA-binding domain-containing protein [Amphibacillus sp. MSJ-3]